MSGVIRLKAGAWPARALEPEAADAVVKSGAAIADEVERMGRAQRRQGWFGVAAGGLVGIMGVGVAAWVTLDVNPAPVQFAQIDPTTGAVSPSVAAVDAPRMFSEDTEKQYLRMFVENCGSYIHDVRIRNYHRCVALMVPTQQNRYRDGVTSDNPDSPQNKLGSAASYIPEGLRFYRRPSEGRVKSWLVRYQRAEYRGGNRVAAVPYSVTVDFEWRPEAKMTEEVRAHNLAGMQVLHYTFGSDIGQ